MTNPGRLVRVSGPANTRFSVATHALTLLAGLPGDAQSSEVLARSIDVNPVHVRRVLGALREAGLVTSRPGPTGGWQLAQRADEITLADVWNAIRGDRGPLDVHQAAYACEVGQSIQAQLEDLDRDLAAAIEHELAQRTVAELARRAPAPAAS